MLSVSVDAGGRLLVGQQAFSPMVYLDHWAMRTISESPSWIDRLTAALGAREGTIALSWANFEEFAKMSDPRQARLAEHFVDRNLPRVFLLEVDPFRVIAREDEIVAHRSLAQPHGDPELLETLLQFDADSLEPFTARGLFGAIQSRVRSSNDDGMANAFVARLSALREELRSEKVRSVPSPPAAARLFERGTRFIFRELVRLLLLDAGRRLTRNDAFDFLHSVVPVAYCDYVLLDGDWQNRIAQVRSRLLNAGYSVPMATVYSKRKNGLEQFIGRLESGV